ncbi:hypothetical protein ANRL4_05604 [Anaerolineae bacterium]|nr:hypothetical protein ANRL4_05604 [Anaerolineae bacterium]
MAELSKHMAAIAAELLADKLLKTYQSEQVPQSRDNFAQAGFTREAIISDSNALYRMIVVAAYDRQPFSQLAGGFENLREMNSTADGIPTLLQRASLWSASDALAESEEIIERRLSRLTIGNHSLDRDDKFTKYTKTLIAAARLAGTGFGERLRSAKSVKELNVAFDEFDAVHGIGETIASKLVKYILREVAIGSAQPADFPLSVAWPITQEYHAAISGETLASLGQDIVALTAGLLCARGDAYAIDALFYLHRHRAWELEEFVKDWQGFGSVSRPPHELVQIPRSRGIADRLMAIIEEIKKDGESVTQFELDAKGLDRKVISAARIAKSCQFLYSNMGPHAATGDVSGMLRFYESCLRSEDGKLVGWALNQVGRKSMESEYERFRSIAAG